MANKILDVEGSIKSDLQNADVSKLTVELHDQNQKVKNAIAQTQTNSKGRFEFELNPLTLKRQFEGISPEVFLVVKKGRRAILSTLDDIVLKLDADISDVKIKLSKKISAPLVPDKKELPQLDVKGLLEKSGVKNTALDAVLAKLKSSGLAKIEAILSRPDRLTPGRTDMDAATLGRFKAITKFAAASSSDTLGVKLVGQGFQSFRDIGSVPKNVLTARLGKLNKAEGAALDNLYQKAANVHNDVSDLAAFNSRLTSRDGLWQLDAKKYKDIEKRNRCRCDACQNVFSPYAYLLNLADMIHDHWGLATRDLEKIFLQEIDQFDCRKGQECFLQIELAIERLEANSRISLPLNNPGLVKSLVEVWATLLFGNAQQESISLIKRLGESGSARIKKLMESLQQPTVRFDDIIAAVKELKRRPTIKELREVSSLYEKGGEEFIKALDRAYQQALVLYRAALIKNAGGKVEQLQNEMFIDLKTGACHKTNRVTFLILSLQAFVLAARTGVLARFDRPDLDTNFRNKIRGLNSIPIEEASWKWLKDYPSWASAMYVFLFPENLAMPFLSERTGDYFSKNMSAFLTNTLDRGEVFKSIYHHYFDEEAREHVRNDNQNIPADDYPLFLKPVIDAGEGYFDAVSIPVETFMSQLTSLLTYYENEFVGDYSAGGHFLLPFERIHKYQLKNSLYFPLLAAFALNKSEDYASAHDWYRLLYDPTKSGNDRYVFDFDAHFNGNLSQTESWINGLLDPNEIAHRREGVMLRNVIIMMVKNLLDWADHEFALATASSLDRARLLYEQAQEILNSPDLGDHCFQSIREFTLEIVTAYGLSAGSPAEAIGGIFDDLNQIDDPDLMNVVIEDIRGVLPKKGDVDPSPIEKIAEIVKVATARYRNDHKPIALADTMMVRGEQMAGYEDQVLQQSAAQSNTGVSPYFFFSGPGFGPPSTASLYVGTEDKAFVSSVAFCVPSNPVLVALDSYIKLSLLKFQLCLDITGEPLPSIVVNEESVAQFFDVVNRHAHRRPGCHLSLSAAVDHRSVLARPFRPAPGQPGIPLVSGSADSRPGWFVDRAAAQLDFWSDRIDRGMLSEAEQQAIFLTQLSIGFQASAAAVQYLMVGPAVIGALGGGAASIVGAGTAIAGLASGGVVSLAGLAAIAGGAGTLATAVVAGGQTFAGALQSTAGALSSAAGLGFTVAGLEVRFEDWTLQRDLSDFDLRISETQKQSANNRIDIANQELTIANLQNTQANEELTFLENKFSNDHLYEWMIQILSQNYRTLMQISSNVAKLAQRALEFERQEKISIVNGDYWSVNSANAYTSNLTEQQKESGLLGAERLLTDLVRLDAFKLSTEKRHLQLSKTISMAQILPGELVELRTTGKITFNTLMNWFDRDFPGHYLRLIKSVKVSMLALTPPTDGIHAMLSNSGESTVVVSDGAEFKSIRAFRDFSESIALDSPFSESGLFVFNYEDAMFLPFEGLGVETQWVLELPKASNRFDFNTIADVLLTIEYTALHSDSYAAAVRGELGNTAINDVPVNIRLQYPDHWYHFKNDPVAADAPRNLDIELPAQFLPAHYDSDAAISTRQVTVLLIGNFDGLSTERLLKAIHITHEYTENGNKKTLKITSQTTAPAGETKFKTKLLQAQDNQFALFSTRDNNDQDVQLAANIDPTGEWRVSIDDIVMTGSTTLGEIIEDVLLVVTAEGSVSWG